MGKGWERRKWRDECEDKEVGEESEGKKRKDKERWEEKLMCKDFQKIKDAPPSLSNWLIHSAPCAFKCKLHTWHFEGLCECLNSKLFNLYVIIFIERGAI